MRVSERDRPSTGWVGPQPCGRLYLFLRNAHIKAGVSGRAHTPQGASPQSYMLSRLCSRSRTEAGNGLVYNQATLSGVLPGWPSPAAPSPNLGEGVPPGYPLGVAGVRDVQAGPLVLH
jgi:hypothetical protein